MTARLQAGLVVAVVALLTIRTSAAPAPFGAYLGCYNLGKMGLSSAETRVRSSGASNWRNCPKTCADLSASLIMITPSGRNYQCSCGFSVPSGAGKIPERNCNRGGMGVAVFYRHAAADRQRCRIFKPSFTNSNFRAAYNPQNVGLSGSQLSIRMNGLHGGTRVEPTYPRQTYGQFQVRASIPCGDGVVSAFYLRSTDAYPNFGPFDEIDYEFVNQAGRTCSIWLNSWAGGCKNGEVQFSRAEYQRVLGWSSRQTTSTWTTYTIDWQPGYVSWFLGGNLLRTYSTGDRTPSGTNFIVPKQPQRPVFSIWSDPVGGFGGRLDPSKGPWTANFQQMRQIVCDRPAPSTPLGPSWLYA